MDTIPHYWFESMWTPSRRKEARSPCPEERYSVRERKRDRCLYFIRSLLNREFGRNFILNPVQPTHSCKLYSFKNNLLPTCPLIFSLSNIYLYQRGLCDAVDISTWLNRERTPKENFCFEFIALYRSSRGCICKIINLRYRHCNAKNCLE